MITMKKKVSLVDGPNQHYKVKVDGEIYGDLVFNEDKRVWVLTTEQNGKKQSKSDYEDLVLSVSQITGDLNAADKKD